jgi:serine/threonine protein kinase
MNIIAGYQILSAIYESANSLVYRGVKIRDRLPVIVKVLKQDYPTKAELQRYEQEYEILRNLNIQGAIKAYSLVPYQRTVALILEDFGGISLRQFMQQRCLTLVEFLNLAVQLCEILGHLHSANVIHKDINPSNIVLNPTTLEVKLIDFGIASVLKRANPAMKNPEILAGTLAYISPEQTGRMNRALDYRTDFYSLGVTFYELLAHTLPFNTSEPMELVHCHIAKRPLNPCQINPEIPPGLGEIILKLIAKNAEDRYQSAWGLQADLVLCLMQLEAGGMIEEIIPGQNDICDRFQITQKLYGRSTEIQTLLSAFNRITENTTGERATEMLLISGAAGVGKTALVGEIYKPLTAKRGYFISGKFDQFQRNTPYSAVVYAFQGLVRQLLAENEATLQQWREKLLAALGQQAQVIINVIPEIELIIGQQNSAPELEGTEAQNRFSLVFQKLVRVFGSQEQPLIVFLDNLQWADVASLNLIKLMMTGVTSVQNLCLIGAYRSEEVDETHALMLTLDAIQKAGVTINQINLEPLKLNPVIRLIADTLYQDESEVKSLAEVTLAKTGGNPFFVNEFLKKCESEGLIYFDSDRLCWNWDIDQISGQTMTDNIVEFAIQQFQQLPASSQQILQLAACIGLSFDLPTLATISDRVESSLLTDLQSALQA